MTQKQRILPIFAIIASIAIMTIPSALADTHDETTPTNAEKITAKIAEHQEVVASLRGVNIELGKIITDKENLILGLETKITTYQDGIDSKSARIIVLQDKADSFPDVLTVEQQVRYDDLLELIVQAENDIALEQAIIDRYTAEVAVNDRIIASTETRVIDNSTMITEIQNRIAALWEIVNNLPE